MLTYSLFWVWENADYSGQGRRIKILINSADIFHPTLLWAVLFSECLCWLYQI